MGALGVLREITNTRLHWKHFFASQNIITEVHFNVVPAENYVS